MQIEETSDPCQLLIAWRSEIDFFGDLLVLNDPNLKQLVFRIAEHAIRKMIVDIAIAGDRRENPDRICPGDASQPPGNLAMLKPIETLIGRVGVVGKIREENRFEIRKETTWIA